MFKKTPKEPTDLDLALKRAYQVLEQRIPGTEEYNQVMKHITKLHKLKMNETKSSDPVSKDALLRLAGTLGGILMIVAYEHSHVITSKALGFVPKS